MLRVMVPQSLGLVPTCLMAGLLASCSDPKAPTAANFRKALEPIVADTFCRRLPLETMSLRPPGDDAPTLMPIIVPATPVPNAVYQDAEGRRTLEDGVAAGLLTRATSTAPARRTGYSVSLVLQALITYTPTAKGEPYFRPVMARTASGMRPFPGLCVARGEVVDVVRWTYPADMFGRTVSRVTYRYRGVDVAPVVPPSARETIEQPQEQAAVLVRADDGWRDDGA